MSRYLGFWLLLCTAFALVAAESKIWVKPIYYADQQYTHDNLFGYTSYAGGLIIGGDQQVNTNSFFGAAISYFNVSQEHINNTDTLEDINSYSAMVFGGYKYRYNLYLEWLASATLNDYKNTRAALSNLSASGSSMGQQYIARATVSNECCTGDLKFIPQLNTNLIYFMRNAYSEVGAGTLNQNIATKHAGVFTLGGGFKMISVYKRSHFKMIPELRCMIFYDVFSAAINPLTAFLIGGPALNTSTTPGRGSGLVGASLTANFSQACKGSISYDLLLKNSYFNNVLSLQLKYIL